MQGVSAGWKTAQEQVIVPESYIEISYKVGDPAAQPDATATDNGSETFSDAQQTLNELEKTYVKYSTLEHNLWVLDGSLSAWSDVPDQDTGFVSSVLSGEDGSFSTVPIITIGFSTVHTPSIPGITIKWSEAFEEYATDFTVSAYNGETLVATQAVTGNDSTLSIVEVDIASYDKIEIEITKWNFPLHRARIEEIIIGLYSVFEKSDLMGYEHSQFVDLLSSELPKAEIVFSLSNVNAEWNPDNPSGLWQYLLKNQEINVRYGYKINGAIEWIKAGTFYMSEWTTPSNGITAQFTARDLLELMQGDFTTASTTLTLYELAEEALTLSNLPVSSTGANRWSIDSSLSAITVTIPADFAYTCAEVVQLCANAACCVFYQDRDGILKIEPLATTLTDYVISKFVSYANAEYEISKELKSVSVNDGLGTASNSTTGEVQTMANPLIQDSTVANAVAAWVKDCLSNRKTLSGEYRPDPRLDVLDKVTIANKYATNTVFITSIKYNYNGSFVGTYQGRAV